MSVGITRQRASASRTGAAAVSEPYTGNASMHIALLRVEIRIPSSHSLKDKRSVLKRLVNLLRSRHNVAVAEIGHQDAWQTAVLGLVTINSLGDATDRILQGVVREVGHFEGCELLDYRIERF
jgi:hypothetical protein